MITLGYIVESLICSGLFLVLYRLMLAKKVNFKICRAYLLTTMILSITIPLMDVPLYPTELLGRINEWTVFSFDEFMMSPAEIEEVTVIGHDIAAHNAVRADISAIFSDMKPILSILYLLTVIIFLGLIVLNAAKIFRLRRRSNLTYEKEYTLAEHEDIKTPFSFIRTIFMGFNYEPEERRQILTHEASHVRHRHSYERLFMSVLRSIFWFNPFFWMAEKDLEEVQEWEADKDVLDKGWNLKAYRTTIFKQLFGYNPDITCGLNHSLTKQRFIMMTQSHRGKRAWIRLAATLPVIAATFFAFGCGTKQAEMTNEGDTSPLFTSDKPVKGPFIIDISEGTENPETGENYFISCNGKLAHIEDIGKLVEEFFAGTPMHQATVHIKAQNSIPMGVLTDVKVQLRNAHALKIRYETDDSAIEKHLPLAQSNPLLSDDPYQNVNRRNIIVVKVNSAGELLLGGNYVKGSLHNDKLYRQEIDKLKGYISNPTNSGDCPSIEMREIQMPDGSARQFRVSNAIVSFHNARGTSYDDYTKAMKLITTAYKELREEVSAEVFGKPLAELSDTEMQVIYRAVPMNVSEVEPRDVPARK